MTTSFKLFESTSDKEYEDFLKKLSTFLLHNENVGIHINETGINRKNQFDIIDLNDDSTYFQIVYDDFDELLNKFFNETLHSKNITTSSPIQNFDDIKKDYEELYYILLPFIEKYYLKEFKTYNQNKLKNKYKI